jgi:hypothetical protein
VGLSHVGNQGDADGGGEGDANGGEGEGDTEDGGRGEGDARSSADLGRLVLLRAGRGHTVPTPAPPLSVRVSRRCPLPMQHRGGASTGTHGRPTFHIAVIGDGAAPTGIPYTVLAEDIREMYPGDPPG